MHWFATLDELHQTFGKDLALTFGNIAKYSNQSSLTTVYRVGEFKTRRVEGGVDINGDGKADFPTEVLSNDEELIASFRGNSTWGANVKGTSFATPNVCGKDAGPNRLAWLLGRLLK